MKKIIILSAVLSASFIIIGCGGSQNSEPVQSEKKQEVKKQVKEVNILATKEGLEARLKEIGLPIYPGAKFKKISTSNSTFDGGHHIVYNLPEVTSQSKNKVTKFYDYVFRELEKNGWETKFNTWREKGNDQFTFAHMYMDNPPMHAIGITYKDKTE